MINEDKDIANHFNNFFLSIGESLTSKFKQTDTNNINVERPVNSFDFKPMISPCP